MKSSLPTRSSPLPSGSLVAAAAFGASTAALAGLTDLATVPLQTSVASKVRPNLLYTLDDSGSMGSGLPARLRRRQRQLGQLEPRPLPEQQSGQHAGPDELPGGRPALPLQPVQRRLLQPADHL